MGLPEFREFFDNFNHDLAEKVGYLSQYDAICEICSYYHIKKPEGNDLIGPDLDRIYSILKP